MYKENKDLLFNKLGDHGVMCLATSQNDIVSARSMSVILYKQKFYFQTDANFKKYKQISENPNVALCMNNIQIQGVCVNLGHPLLSENSFFADLFKQFYQSSFENYSALKDEFLFEVTPTIITIWDYEDNKPYRAFYDFVNETYHKEYYKVDLQKK